MALQDSVRSSLESRLTWLKNYYNTITQAHATLDTIAQEVADIEAILAAVDDDQPVNIPVAKRQRSQGEASVEENVRP